MGKYDKIRKYIDGGPLDAGLNQTTIDQSKDKIMRDAITQQIRANMKEGFLQSTGMQMLEGLGKSIKADPTSFGTAVAGLAVDTATNALVGDKNFDEESQATDELANGAANIVGQFGPWGKVAALGIKAVNAADKLAGQTVPGYKVNMTSSGFGGVKTEMGGKSNRLLQMGNLDKQMDRRNQQAQMALAAAQLDKDNDFMMEARGNSVGDVMKRNKNALDGGLGLDALGA